jgi:hypothetical protein
MINFYSFLQCEYISEESQDDLFIIHDSFDRCEQILFVAESEHISEEIHHYLFIVDDSFKPHDQILFLNS